MSARRLSTIPNWAPITQGRRAPIGRYSKWSIKGPTSNLKAQGSRMIPRKEAIFAGETPSTASQAGRAMCSKPIGMPWAK